jgi:hypothetical protein
VFEPSIENDRSAARFRGLIIVADSNLGFSLRFTPGFMLSPAPQAGPKT